MKTILIEKLSAFILINNPDLIVQLQTDYSVTQYLDDKVALVIPLIEKLINEEKPSYIIEELCLREMTADLVPSRFSYIKEIISEEFSEDFERLSAAGVVTYETINLIEYCKDHFESFGFTKENEDNRFLRYAVIAAIHDYFN